MRELFRLLLITASLLGLTSVGIAEKTKIIHEKKGINGLGINVIPKHESRWKSKVMLYPGRVTDKDRAWTDSDFFTYEFGEPCIFTKDWIKKHGYCENGKYKIKNGEMVFKTGRKGFSFSFGPKPNEFLEPNSKPSLRFGAAWGKALKDRYRIKMELQQNASLTNWEFCTTSFYKNLKNKKFQIKGKGEHVFESDVGFVRNLMDSKARRGMCGFRLKCLTPGVTVKIKSIKIAPSSALVYFRKSFALPEKPVMAHASFQASEAYDLYINGKKVSSGTHIYPAGTIKTVDLLPYLRKGPNIIAFKREFISWSGGKPEWLFEGVCIEKNGKIIRLLGDKSWKCSLAAKKGWTSLKYNDSSWKKPKLCLGIKGITMNPTADRRFFYTGIDPRHMGMLKTSPYKRQYPVFNYKEPARFELELPSGVKGRYVPELKVYKAGTDELVEAIKASGVSRQGGLIHYVFNVKGKKVGPYRLEWILKNIKGKEIEKRLDEMIVAGAIEQDEVPLADFENEFNKRLKLIKHIDCAAPISSNEEFLDHSGMYHRKKTNKGKVVFANGMKYRETGPNSYDYFAYRLHLKDLGKPVLVEIIVPDDKKRYIYSGIVQQFPVAFKNNPQDGSRSHYSATGSAYTGVNFPLSFKKKKIRYIYYPASQCSAVVVMTGFTGSPAAACEINIYEIKGGLPALIVPETERMFGSHNERMSVMMQTLGMIEHPLMGDRRVRLNGHRDAWFHWYKAIERKIKLLRFQGRNMTVEGAYMYYRSEYPSLKHSGDVSNQELDPLFLAVKMYNKNSIKCMLGMEYMASPQIFVSGIDNVSDRKMWNGKEGLHLVDKYGRQITSHSKSGINFLAPAMRDMFLDCVSEIYRRYSKAGKVSGMFLVSGRWWMPGFTQGNYADIANVDVGYGDYTVGLFEKETGINLNITDKSPRRFQKRHKKLMGEFQTKWLSWRSKKIKDFCNQIAGRIQCEKEKWRLYIYPAFKVNNNSPFMPNQGSKEARNNYMESRYKESGFPLGWYKGNENITIVIGLRTWAKYRYPESSHLPLHGWNTNRGSRKIVKDFGAVYLKTDGLDEVDSPADAAKKWLWKHTSRGVFMPRGIEENAMWEYVNVISSSIPNVIFYSWLDCNMDTGFSSQLRRFCKSYYVTPPINFTELPEKNSRGVMAQSGEYKGKVYLRLINNTPFKIKGRIKVDASSLRDLVYDRKLNASGGSGLYSIIMLPNDIRIIALKDSKSPIKCNFVMLKKENKRIIAQAEYILSQKNYCREIPGDMLKKISKAMSKNDAFAVYGLLQDFEVQSKIQGIKKNQKYLENQKIFDENLKKGRARIICASPTKYIDSNGNHWLPDQSYTKCGAYGNIGANFADRGALPIEGTDLDRIYQTEAYGGHVKYKIPVPKGKYNLYIHFAETYVKNKRPGCRQITVKIEHKTRPRKVDPFVLAGGWAKPYVMTIRNVPVNDGMLDIEMIGGVGVSGIEVERGK